MDINGIVEAVSAVGFPIAFCLIMFWYLEKEQENHKQEMDAVKDALAQNTLALTELKEFLRTLTGMKNNGGA